MLCLPVDMQRTNTRENSSSSWIFAGILSLGLSSHSSNLLQFFKKQDLVFSAAEPHLDTWG
jgi:hypothetical protein